MEKLFCRSANADGPCVGAEAADFNSGSETQRVGDVGDAGAQDGFAGDDVNGGGGLVQGRGRLVEGAHLDVAELFKGQALQVLRRARGGSDLIHVSILGSWTRQPNGRAGQDDAHGNQIAK